MLWYVIQGSNMWSTKWQDENQNRVEEPMNTNQHFNSIKEQNNLQNKQTKHALQKKDQPWERFWHTSILFSARLYRTDVETYNIQRERDRYIYIWVIFFTDGLENNLHELLYYNIFLVYPPFAYAISSLAHMELLNCHGPWQPLEGAHWHMSSVLLHVAWFHTQLDSKT